MCGIVGFFHANPIENPSSILERMKQAISHRGPDGQGEWIGDMAALGHVRLAILDIGGGAQPMTSPDGRLVLTYNGEIYNYRELKSELTALGHIFQTECDTEVILHAWNRWEKGCLERLNGMFAFAIWDNQKRRGFLVRDPAGIKPLFYFAQGNTLYFASEVKAILKALLSKRPKMDEAALHFLMNFRYLPGEMTLWKGIKQLLPGHLLSWSAGQARTFKWASYFLEDSPAEGFPMEAKTSPQGLDDYVAMLLEGAVKGQLVSDVPIGGYLSSGMDSGIIAAISSRALRGLSKEYPTFTIATGDSPLEAEGARETAEYLGIPNFRQDIELNVEKHLRPLIYHLETPKVNALQSALVAGLASKHVKVALSGLGGDEVFLGYNIHKIFKYYKLIRKIPLGSTLLGVVARVTAALFPKLPPKAEEVARGLLMAGQKEPPVAYGIVRNVWDGIIDKRLIYGPRILDKEKELASPFQFLKERWSRLPKEPVKALQAFEMQEKMVNDLLWNEDRVSMARGLEVRVPFLDRELMDFGLKCQAELLMKNGKLKGLLREVGKRWLPEHIINRPKSGFQVPIHHFFDQQLRPLCRYYLEEKRVREDGLFNPAFIREILAHRPTKHLRWHYFMLYLMLGMTIWLELFEGNGDI